MQCISDEGAWLTHYLKNMSIIGIYRQTLDQCGVDDDRQFISKL